MIEQLTKYGPVVVAFGTAVGLAYLFGYWGYFGINPLEHIGLSDVVRLSLYPMLGAILAVALGAVGGPISQPDYPQQDTQAPLLGVWVLKHMRWLYFAWLLLFGAAIAFGREPWKWVIVMILIGALAIPIALSSVVKEAIPNLKIRHIVVLVLVASPASGFSFGRAAAHKIREGRAHHAIDAGRLPAALGLRSTAQKPIMYAGRLGDRLAFYETLSAQLILVREDQVPVLPVREK